MIKNQINLAPGTTVRELRRILFELRDQEAEAPKIVMNTEAVEIQWQKETPPARSTK